MRFRFSLRAFLLSIVVVTGVLGLWTRRSLDQATRVHRLEGVHLHVVYDLDDTQNDWWLSSVRRWIASRVGKDWTAVPLELKAKTDGVYPEDLQIAAGLRSLRSVNLAGTSTDDSALSAIAALPALESLNITDTLVTTLLPLETCKSIQELRLGGTVIPQSAIEEFRIKNPNCGIVGAALRSNLNNLKVKARQNVRADRVPTAAEKTEFDTAIKILETTDNLKKVEIAAAAYPDLYNGRSPGNISGWPPDWGHYEEVARLGELGLAAGIPTLESIAHDDSRNEQVRCQAVQSLAMIPDKRIVPILIELLSDPSVGVARTAGEQLHAATLQEFDGTGIWEADPQGARRQALIKHWRAYWKEYGDVLRPRRVAEGPVY